MPRRPSKPHVIVHCPANAKTGTDERVIEFSGGYNMGGLVSFKRHNGVLRVEPYRLDDKVRVVPRVGKMHAPHALRIIGVYVGTADAPSGKALYTMLVGAGAYTPMIRSEKTGRTFTLSWQDIIKLAEQAGIDDPNT